MLSVVTEDDSKRAAIIELGVSETGLSGAILEKDLWVCYLLDYLFHRSEFKGSIIFKGGTSLSKAFGLIERFSEDVDLILDWRLIGYGLNEPWEDRSNTKQDKFKLEIIERTDDYLANTFVPSLKAGLSTELGIEADVRMGDAEETVLFAYPRLFSNDATLDVVKLEIGPLAAWTPSQPATITSYLAELHPQLFASPSTVVATAAPERTFWEKATILHQEANRPEGRRCRDVMLATTTTCTSSGIPTSPRKQSRNLSSWPRWSRSRRSSTARHGRSSPTRNQAR